MISAKQFGTELKRLGFRFYSGVPCSFLNPLINYAINDCTYVAATNEGEAVAIASGAYLGGTKPVVLMQNSGLTNASSPLVSLTYPFQIPVLGFVSLRGEQGIADEPQHELMGRITTQMLDLMQVKWSVLASEGSEAKRQLAEANAEIESNRPYFFVVRKGTFETETLQEQRRTFSRNISTRGHDGEEERPTRYDTLSTLNALKDRDTVQLATTGKTGRELHEIEDARNNLYMVGSMGCISSLGLGLALTKRSKDVVVIDGDGSLLMRLGNLATNAFYGPPNLLHILLDNHVHDSTGGQHTVSHNINFVTIAASCGYASAYYVHNLAELETRVRAWKQDRQLTFLYMKIAPGSNPTLGRPKLKPVEVKQRLQVFLND